MADKSSSFDSVIIVFALIAVVVSLIAAGVTYYSVANLVSRVTTFATSTGEANLTVETLANVNFTTRAISWGSGRVNPASSAAALTTFATDNVTGGNWTLTTAGGLRLENIGNVNVSLNLSVGKNASEFIGGSNPVYEWNLTAVEANSCLNNSGVAGGTEGLRLNRFFQANTTAYQQNGGLGCSVFRFESGNDLLRLDFNLTIPENSQTGALGDVVTATVTAL